MSIIRIKDQNGNIIDIPAIKGNDYILTEADKENIANKTADLIQQAECIPLGSAANKLAQLVDKTIAGKVTADDLEGATRIAGYMFMDCNNLISVTIPDTVTRIGNSAFYRSKNLKYVTIPKSVISIEQYAFMACNSLLSVNVGALTFGGQQIFRGCENLKNVTLDEGLTRIYDSMFSECASLESIIIPNSVTIIESSAFSLCTSLKSIDIPNNVTEIKSYAFSSCTSLTSVKISDTCDWIWERVFNGCTSLTSLTIPASVERIRDALQIGSAENKATITFLRTTPASIYSDTFKADYLEKIIVPKGCGEAYRTATNWANFADYIEEATE